MPLHSVEKLGILTLVDGYVDKRIAFAHFLQLAMTSFAHFLRFQLRTIFTLQSEAISD